jgi:hypothetical protein
MNAVPSVIYLLNRKRFYLSDDMRFLWTMLALLACLLVGAFMVSPSSTVVDRLGLYLIPIQLMVFGNLPAVFAKRKEDVHLINLACIVYYAVVQFVWFNFATNAINWLPYRSLLTS